MKWPWNRNQAESKAAPHPGDNAEARATRYPLPATISPDKSVGPTTADLASRTSDLAAAKPLPALPIPRTGRSSVEEPRSLSGNISSWMSSNAPLTPAVPIEYLYFLEAASILNYDMAHAVGKTVRLANTGHKLIIDDPQDRKIALAQDTLNALAQRAYPLSAGIDGYVNACLRQLAVGGAVSGEAALLKNLKGIDRFWPVPVRSIRFKLVDGDYHVFQQASSLGNFTPATSNLIPLNELTYHYFAAETMDGSPYAIPPMTAAIKPSLIQADMMESLTFVLKKMGLLGLVECAVTPPPRRGGESDNEYQTRCGTWLADVASAISGNYRDGVMVHYTDQEMKHFNVSAAGSAGAEALNRLIEQMVISGMQQDPSMMGRNYANGTDTWARVMYQAMIAGFENYRRLVKRLLGIFYQLELRLAGIEVADMGISFNPSPSLSPNLDELAKNYQVSNVTKKIQNGIIDPDRGAQELGYDEAADPERALAQQQSNSPFGAMFAKSFSRKGAKTQRRIFKYEGQFNRYEFLQPRIVVRSSLPATRYPLPATHSHGRGCACLEGPDAPALSWIQKYIAALAPGREDAINEAGARVEDILKSKSAGDFASPEAFADEVFAAINTAFRGALSSEDVQKAVSEQVGSIYKNYLLKDTSLWKGGKPPIKIEFGAFDERAVNFAANTDSFYVSTFVDNEAFGSAAKDFITQRYLADGEKIFGRGDPQALADFREAMSGSLDDLSDYEVRRIAETSTVRMRSWAHISQMAESGWAKMKIVNGANPCEYCKAAAESGAISVENAHARITELLDMSPEDFGAAIAEESNLVPLHPFCNCRVRPVL